MRRDWKLVGAAIKRARALVGNITQQQLADAAGVSRSSVQALEAGRIPGDDAPPTLAHIERVFGWPTGTGTAIAEGAEAPAPDGLHISLPTAAAADPAWAEQLPTLVREELRHSTVLNADVITLDGADSRLKLVVVAVSEGEEQLTPEELRRAQAQWQKSRQRLWTAGEGPVE